MHTNVAGASASRNARREIDDAQLSRAYRIAGEPLARVPFGLEIAGVARCDDRCADCAASPGEYHVPGCEHEQCPACGGRVISCRCAYGRPNRHSAA